MRLPASTLLAIAVSITALPASVHAYTIKTTAAGHRVRWTAPRVELALGPVSANTFTRAQAASALREASAAWSEVPGAPAFAVVERPELRFDLGAIVHDGVNGVYVLERWPFADRRLAVTISVYAEDTGVLIEADVLVNGEMPLATSGAAADFDLTLVLTHELGHVLGLDESDVPEATMWPDIRRGEIERRALAPDDVDGVTALYPAARSPMRAGAGCSVSGRAPARWWIALALVALVALARERAERK